MGRSTQGLRTGAAGVCRKLFANDSTDRTDPSAFLKRMDAELHMRNMKRWNFDFQTETPLPGRYKWVPVGEPVPVMKPAPTQLQTAEIRPQPSSSSMQASKNKKNTPSTQSKITAILMPGTTLSKLPHQANVPLIKRQAFINQPGLESTARVLDHEDDDMQ
ncbi:uncharacterized protein TNCV_2130801 [Trichonephila clavipes]|nr:uncharacterized protein TNCV_2130801 [Trichonephila clavipes]